MFHASLGAYTRGFPDRKADRILGPTLVQASGVHIFYYLQAILIYIRKGVVRYAIGYNH